MPPLLTIWVTDKKTDVELLKVLANPVNCKDIKRIFRLRLVKLNEKEHQKIKKRKYDTPLLYDGRNKIYGGQPILDYLQKIVDKKYQVASSRKGKANSMHDMMMRTLREEDDQRSDDMDINENLQERANRAAEERKNYHGKFNQRNNLSEPTRKPNTWEERSNAPRNSFRENIQPAPLGEDERRLVQRNQGGQSGTKRKLRNQPSRRTEGTTRFKANPLGKEEEMLRKKMGF